jgi:hypothetical protein
MFLGDFVSDLNVQKPQFDRFVVNNENGSLLVVPNTYYLYFIYNINTDGAADTMIHSGVYENATEAVIGLTSQYKKIDDDNQVLNILNEYEIESDGSLKDKYELLREDLKNISRDGELPIIIYKFKLPMGGYPIETEIVEGNVPSIFDDLSMAPNVNNSLRELVTRLHVSIPKLKEVITTNGKNGRHFFTLPGNYFVYFIYNIHNNAIGQLLHCNVYSNATDAFIGMYNQYKRVNPDMALDLISSLLQTAPGTQNEVFDSNKLASIVEYNYMSNKSPFYIKWFSVPQGDYTLETTVQEVKVQKGVTRKSEYNAFMTQRIAEIKNTYARTHNGQPMEHKAAFRQVAEEWKRLKATM